MTVINEQSELVLTQTADGFSISRFIEVDADNEIRTGETQTVMDMEAAHQFAKAILEAIQSRD